MAHKSASVMAFDKSVRSYDEDGRMHVETTPISRAAVNEYYGAEIPEAEKLGLDPQRKYKLLRDPEELKKAAGTFNNLPLMIKHVRQSADDPQKDKIVGSTGTDAEFDHPHLTNSLVVWDQDGIDGIESKNRRELSCSYRYDADMTPGAFEGQSYDGVMRNIRGNHVALVKDGRAGPDCLVEDAMPPGMRNPQENNMPVSRKALLVRGALAAYLKPKLAMDAKIDLKPVLLGTTAANWTTAKPTIAQRLREVTAGKLAKDATLADMHEMLDSLDKEGEGEPDTMDAEPESEEDKRKREEKEARDKAARDEEAETEEEKAERMKRRQEAKDKAARDAEMPEAKMERERKEKEASDKAARDRAARDMEPKPITKAAMDEAMATQRREIMADAQRLRDAERAVEPLIGKLVLAQDSADAVYRLALETVGVKAAGVHASALPAMVEMAKQNAAQAARATPRLAHDAAAAKTFAEAHPEVARIRIL